MKLIRLFDMCEGADDSCNTFILVSNKEENNLMFSLMDVIKKYNNGNGNELIYDELMKVIKEHNAVVVKPTTIIY